MAKSNQWMFSAKDDPISLDKWQKTVDLMTELFSAPAGFIVQAVEEGYRVVIASKQKQNPYSVGGTFAQEVNIFCKKVVNENRDLYVKHASEDRYWDDNPEVNDEGFESYLGLPIHWPNGTVFGTICVMEFQATDYHKKYIDLIKQLRELVEDDLALLDNYTQMREVAMLDPLTNLYNRRALSVLAQQKLTLAKRLDFNVACLYMDLNDFKALNDQHGHEMGDKALKALAQVLKLSLREADIVGRIGGDEFAAIIHIADPLCISTIVEKIRHGYATLLAQRSMPQVHLSIGSSLLNDLEPSFEHLLNKADQQMYINKQAFKQGEC